MPQRFISRPLFARLILLTPALAATGWGAPKLSLQKWSGKLNVPDPVACTVAPDGTVYVTQTTRRKVGDLDIREHTQWIPNDLSFTDIEQKRAFYHEVLAPGKFLKPEGELRDHNGDGSIDWHDLTVHTEKIWQLKDTDGDGTADKMTLFAEGFNTEVTGIAAGILWHDGWVYCTIAPDLWRLRDTNGDGVADERESIVHGFGHHIAYAGHDMHGLAAGLDGRIYWSIGDKGVGVTTKDGRRMEKPHEGCVLRCDPDGANFEIFAHGLRNVQEIAFDEAGNLFGVDNDADKTGEKERLVYITPESDSGWRCYYQHKKDFNPWTSERLWEPRHAGQPSYLTPPLASSHDGPAGFVWNPGAALSPEWRGTFFLNQFPSGKMAALRVEADGASFRQVYDEQVAGGPMGIGMSWGPEGRLYFADWDGGYPLDQKGAVWTADDAAGAADPVRLETAGLLRGGVGGFDPLRLVALLSHADQRVRLAAQRELVKHSDAAALGSVAADRRAARVARFHAIWGLERVAPGRLWALLDDADAEIQAQVLRTLGNLAQPPVATGAGERVAGLLKSSSPRVRFFAGLLCGKWRLAGAVPGLLAAVSENADRDAFLRHALVTGLAGAAGAEALAARAAEADVSVRRAALLALRRREAAEVAVFLKDADADLAAEAARAIYDVPIVAALPALAAQSPVSLRSLGAAFRLGMAEPLLACALDPAAALELRTEALRFLPLWTKPPVLDPVIGAWRPLEPRAKEPLMQAVQPRLEALLTLKEPALQELVLALVSQLDVPVPPAPVAAIVASGKSAAAVRVAAFTLLSAHHAGAPEFPAALTSALAAGAPSVLRSRALDHVAATDKPRALAAITSVLATGCDLAERQHAIAVLPRLEMPEADALIESTAKQAAPALALDLAEAAALRPALAGRVPAPGADYSECLDGGDARAGSEIVLTHPAANCVACHRFTTKPGSEVGPALFAIGSQRDAAYILQALVDPGAVVAPGYGMVAATLKDGSTVSGGLAAETPDALQLRQPDGKILTVLRGTVASSSPPVSVMPPMSAILSRRQIRDVVAYLRARKEKPAARGKAKDDEHGVTK